MAMFWSFDTFELSQKHAYHESSHQVQISMFPQRTPLRIAITMLALRSTCQIWFRQNVVSIMTNFDFTNIPSDTCRTTAFVFNTWSDHRNPGQRSPVTQKI